MKTISLRLNDYDQMLIEEIKHYVRKNVYKKANTSDCIKMCMYYYYKRRVCQGEERNTGAGSAGEDMPDPALTDSMYKKMDARGMMIPWDLIPLVDQVV